MKRKKAIFFVLFGSDLGGVCLCVCVCVCVCACAGERVGRGALLSLIGMFTNLSNANIKLSSCSREPTGERFLPLILTEGQNQSSPGGVALGSWSAADDCICLLDYP